MKSFHSSLRRQAHQLIQRLMPRRFTLQLSLIMAAMLVISISAHTLYTTMNQTRDEQERLIERSKNLLSNLAVTCANPLLTRDYGAVERMLMLSANSEELRAIRIFQSERADDQPGHPRPGETAGSGIRHSPHRPARRRHDALFLDRCRPRSTAQRAISRIRRKRW
jgi:hypothetical protein